MCGRWSSSSVGAVPAKAQGVGSVGGTVADASGGVLPGVNVTITAADGGLGSGQTTVTNDQGVYQFTRLVPGIYVVKAELQGFRPAEQRNIQVNSDQVARADLTLEIGTLAEGVTVSGEAPLLDTSTALKQTVISRDVLEALPNRTDVWSIARVIPGVVMSKVDVGGTEQFLQSSASVRGNANENKFTIDGMDVSSLDGNASIATMYLDPYAFQETNFMMGAGSAENSNGGLTFNMVTRSGTNQFHGGALYNGTFGPLADAQNFDEEMEKQLLAAVPPLALQANPGIDAERRHPEDVRRRRVDRGPGHRGQTVVRRHVARPALRRLQAGKLQPGRHAGHRRQHHVDRYGKGHLADDTFRAALVLPQPAVQADRSSWRRHVRGRPRPQLQRQIPDGESGEVHLAHRHEDGVSTRPTAGSAPTTHSDRGRK